MTLSVCSRATQNKLPKAPGAASLAAAIKLSVRSPTVREGLRGKKVVGILTGGNYSSRALCDFYWERGRPRPQ